MVGSSVCRKLWLERIPGRPLLVWLFPGPLMDPLLMLYAALALKASWLGQEGQVYAAFACLDSIATLEASGQVCRKDDCGRLEVTPSASHAGLSALAMTEGMMLCPCNGCQFAKRISC